MPRSGGPEGCAIAVEDDGPLVGSAVEPHPVAAIIAPSAKAPANLLLLTTLLPRALDFMISTRINGK